MKEQTTVLVGLVLMVACGEVESELTTTQDSAGVRITTNVLGMDDERPSCSLAPNALVDFGAAADDPAFEFTEVAGVARLADGRYVVVDRGTQEVRFFDAGGGHVATVGRDGEGPGEFRDPIRLVRRPGDTLVVFDWRLQRLSWFTPTGEFVRSVDLRPAQENPMPDVHVVGAEPSIWLGKHVAQFPAGTEYVEQSLQLLRFDRAGQLRDTVATLPYGSLGWVSQASGMVGSPLFEPKSVWTVQGDRVIIATGQRDELEVWNAEGGLTQIIRWPGTNRQVTDAFLAAYREQRLAQYLGSPREALMRRRLEGVPVMDQLPAVTEVILQADGTLWVREYSITGLRSNTWLAFERDGQIRCHLTLPDGFQVHAFDRSTVLGALPDALDVPHVVAYEISTPMDAGNE